MKKIYSAPLIEVVKIRAEKICDGSIGVNGSTDGEGFVPAGKDNDEEYDPFGW